MASIVIDLQLRGVSSIVQGARQANKSIASINQGSNSIGKSITAQTNALRQNQGPMQRYIASVRALQGAQRSGNFPAIFDAQAAVNSASRSVSRAQAGMQPPSFGSRVSRAISSSRVGFGGGSGGASIAPMMGQLGNLLGPEFAGPVGIAATAVMGLAKAAQIAGEALGELRNTKNANFTSEAGARAIRNVEEAYPGISAQGINQAIQGGGIGAAAVRKQFPGVTGHNFAPGVYGDINNADAMNAAIAAIRNAKSDDAANRIARDLGQPDLMNLRNMSGAAVRQLEGAGMTGNSSEDAARSARDVGARRGIEGGAAAITDSSFPVIAYNLSKNIVSWLSGGPTAPVIKGFGPGLPGFIPGVGGSGSADKGEKLNKSIDKLTDAMDRNSVALGNTGKSYGGGERAAGMPLDAWTYEFFAKENERKSIQMGASRL